MWVKRAPDDHEKALLERARKYARILSWIPGIEMIAVVNSVSMYATHPDSDIDFFIITRPKNIWFVRFFATTLLWSAGVWRHGEDIAWNICLSFFITTEAMDLEKIAIDNDIYLAFWIEYMIPLYNHSGTYEAFMEANNWRTRYTWKAIKETWPIKTEESSYMELIHLKARVLTEMYDGLLKSFLMKKALKSFQEKWEPAWVIISDTMLKFHDNDQRTKIRDEIMKKYFDK